MKKGWLCIWFCFACATTSENLSLSYSDEAFENFRRAEAAYEKKDWLRAQRYYERVVTKFAYSELAAMAELRLADVDYARADSVSARIRYEDFVKSQPTHPKADWAKFRVALTYFEEMPSTFFALPPAYEKDQTGIRAAHSSLLSFLRDYPHSEHTKEARALLQQTGKRLAKHELYVAEFYAKRKYWPAAIARLENIVREHGEAGFEREVFFGLYRAHHALGDMSAAQESLERLIQAYPASGAAKEATALLERSKKPQAAPAKAPAEPLPAEPLPDKLPKAP